MSLYLGDKEMSIYVGDVLVSGSSGPKTGFVDVLVVGGGGGAGGVNTYDGGQWLCVWGAGAGGLKQTCGYPIQCERYDITVGKGGTDYNNGTSSCFDSFISLGGGGIRSFTQPEGCFGSGSGCNGKGTPGQGYNGGTNNGSGGGGAGGCGETGVKNSKSGDGGIGVQSDFDGTMKYYAGGGAGGMSGRCPSVWPGCANPGCGYDNCGGGGSNGLSGHCNGKNGVVILRYKTDGSCGLRPTSYGGCRYNCGNWTIHCFTNINEVEQFIPVYK